MSRGLIGIIIAVLILALTGVAYTVTTSNFESKIQRDLRGRLIRAQQQLIQNSSLEGLRLLKQVEALANDLDFVRALQFEGGQRTLLANIAFRRFMAQRSPGEPRPDLIGLTDATGDVVALLDVDNPLPSMWKNDQDLKYPALELALSDRYIISEIWSYEKLGLMKVGVAPIVNHNENVVVGCLVVAYAITAREAQRGHRLLGAEIAYFGEDVAYATSFTRATGEEDTAAQGELTAVLKKKGLGTAALTDGVSTTVQAKIGSDEYLLTAGRLPRLPNRPLPESYQAANFGAVVMMSVSEAEDSVADVKMTILLLGASAFVIAMLGMSLVSKRILHQADEIEDGINDIINGNLERTIRPVGADLDGLANALNVMLARLLGRPEPGEEVYDDQGNLVTGSAQVTFDNEELAALKAADPATVALAKEPEPEYYTRIFNEYLEARKQVGLPITDIHYENFVTKLRLNEGNLKDKYQCSAVRFRVTVQEGKVTLKPVPIV